MKTLKVLFLVALTSNLAAAVAHAQGRSMADATYALKGPVRTFKTEVAIFVLKDGNYVEGPRVTQTQAMFNTDGNRTDLYLYNNKGILSRRIEMKFDGRKMIECINYDGAGKVWLRIVDSYDNEGRVKESISYNGDGSLRSKKGLKRNDRGQIIELTEYSAAGVLLEQINNKYEGANLHISERKLYRPDGLLQSTELYTAPYKRRDTTTYRPDGSVANKSIRIDQEIAHYNADGTLQKFTTISDQGRLLDELNLNKPQATRESQVPDEIDAQGNWTRQTKWLVDANGTRPLHVTYRAISYYQK